MSNQNNTQPIQQPDFFDNAIDEQTKLETSKDWKTSEIKKLRKHQAKLIKTINNAFIKESKDLTDEIAIKSMRLGFDSKILQIEAQFAPQITALKVSLELAGEAIGGVAGEKFGATVAPVTKTVGNFLSTFGRRSGITK